jgi:pimeloyl-ACP methyl ester carboxylesterase
VTVLILLHGTRFDARQWNGYADRMPEADVKAVDLPGHGSARTHPWTSQAACAAIDVALADVDPGRPVVIAGHSLGGYVAAEYARQHPDRLAALVLIGATADPRRHGLLVRLYTGFARLIPLVGADRLARSANGVLRLAGVAGQDCPDGTGYAATPQAWQWVIGRARPEDVAGLACPVFLVAGQFDQMRIDIDRYADACRDARIRIIPRASHLAPLTHRDEVVAVLREAVAATG